MATYVNDLRLKEIGTGESSGTWGTETNVNLELIGEALSFGTEGITTNADTHTSTVADGSTDPARSMYIKYTGTLDSACTITIAPNTLSRLHFIENGTSGSQNIIISQGSGANVTIPPGDVKVVYLDGAGSGAAVVDAFASLNVVDLKVGDDLTVTDDATIGGTLGVTGILTCTDDIIIGDGKTIGSASDVDAMTIAANGQVTFTQTLIGTALDISGDIDVDGTTNLDAVDIDGTVNVANALTMATTNRIQFNDADVYINSSTDGQLDLVADTEIQIAATTIDINGALTQDGGAVFNEASADVDFRVESNSNTHMLFVDAGNDRVSIATTTPEEALHVTGTLRIDGNNNGITSGEAVNQIIFKDLDTTTGGGQTMGQIDWSTLDSDAPGVSARIAGTADSSTTGQGRINFFTGAQGTLVNNLTMAAGEVCINQASNDMDFRVESNSNTHMIFMDGGNDRVMVGKSSTGLANQGVEFEDGQIKGTATGQTVAFLNRASDDGTILDVRKDNSVVGTIGSNAASGVPVLDIGSNSSSGIIRFLTSGTEVVRLTTSQHVGIGTTSADSILDVEDVHSQLRLTDSDDSKFVLFSYSGGKLIVRNNNASTTVNQFTLLEDGKFGLGTISPVATAHIVGSGTFNHTPGQNTTSDAVITSSEMTDSAYHSIMQLISVRQSLSTGNAANGYLGFSTVDDSNAVGKRDAGRIAIVNEAGTSANSTTALSFWTNSGSADTTAAVEKLRINSLGRVMGFTTTNKEPTDTPEDSNSYVLGPGYMFLQRDDTAEVKQVVFGKNGSEAGNITTTSQTFYNSASDYRLKENIKSLKNSLERVQQLNPVQFDWKESGQTSEGFIAHEVQEIFSDAVTGEKDGKDMQGVDYGRITPLLVKAIQEQQAQIDALQSEIKILKGE